MRRPVGLRTAFEIRKGATLAALRQAEADNRALIAAHELAVPVIYFRGIAPGQYAIVAPACVMAIDASRRLVELEAGLPGADIGDSDLGLDVDLRRYATREALVRLHQHRFRAAVLRAPATRCAVYRRSRCCCRRPTSSTTQTPAALPRS